MLSRLFLWFYCLPFPQAFFVIGLATALTMWLHHRLRQARWWKILMVLLLLAGTFAVLVQTVLRRTPGEFQEPVLRLLDSYRQVLNGGNIEILRSNFMNVVLFYPLGLLPALLLSRKKHPVLRIVGITAVFFLLSFGIEYAQLRWGLGLCEADDVLHNTLGAFLGALTGSLFPVFFPEK